MRKVSRGKTNRWPQQSRPYTPTPDGLEAPPAGVGPAADGRRSHTKASASPQRSWRAGSDRTDPPPGEKESPAAGMGKGRTPGGRTRRDPLGRLRLPRPCAAKRANAMRTTHRSPGSPCLFFFFIRADRPAWI